MTHRRRRTPARSRGFTLLELILAMTIAAMLSLALYAALSSAMRIRKLADSQLAAPRRAAIAMDLLESDLRSLVPAKGGYAGTFVGETQGGTGAGEADTLTFCCVGRERTENATVEDPLAEGVRQVQIGLQTDGASPALVRRVTRNLLAPTTTDYEDEVLVDNVRSFTVRYFDGNSWLEAWDSNAQVDTSNPNDAALPQAIELTLELNDAGPRASADAPGGHGYRVSRIIPIVLATPPADSSSDTSSSATGGT